ncbi:MAG: hypothetical protein ACHQRM_08875, partial [Bacteroidia bacterium]
MWVLLIIMIGIAALIALFSFDLSWNNVVVKERNDLVFENKNKEYGAFMIRRDYNQVLILSLCIAIGFAAVATVGPMLLSRVKEEVKIESDKVVAMQAPPPTNPDQPPPP